MHPGGCTIPGRRVISVSLRGILEIRALGLFFHLPDLLFGIFIGVIGHLWQQCQIVEAIQCSNRVWHLPSWGFGTSYGSDLFLHWSLLSIQPLEACSLLFGAFCSNSYHVYGSHLLCIPDQPHSCIKFLLIIVIKVRSCYWFHVWCIL
jgi:hypothetical protein